MFKVGDKVENTLFENNIIGITVENVINYLYKVDFGDLGQCWYYEKDLLLYTKQVKTIDKQKCTSNLQDLMLNGCKCGGI